MTVSSTLTASCSVSAGALSFGTSVPTPMTVAIDADAPLTLTCSSARPYTVALSAGSGTGATPAERRMAGPGGAVATYSIYREAARTTVWGTGTDATVAGVGSGAAQTLTAYGRMPVQNVPAGTYSDSVTVTVTF